jgi:hypothetical protein
LEPIERQRHTRRGRTFEVRLHYDPHPTSPEDWDAEGKLYSLGRRHANYDPDEVRRIVESGADHVPLSCYEHGGVVWAVMGELPAMCRDPWDSVDFAGVWVPDKHLLEMARNYGGRTRQLALRKWARQFLENYNDYANGRVYGYQVVELVACAHCGQVEERDVDSCWGFYGYDYCLEEALAAMEHEAAGTPVPPSEPWWGRFWSWATGRLAGDLA